MIMKIVNLLKAFSDKTRLRIINLLYRREVCNCEITEILNISQPAVTKHIKKLKKIGILNERRKGWWSYYSLNLKDEEFKKIILDVLNGIKNEKIAKNDLKKLGFTACDTQRRENERYKVVGKKGVFKSCKK
ncbi:MAG: metalloregulator ArsR/SmtB family transcription factor [Elusimicrobiales bacterium]|nr:metalloregulator ArsR/SmtB family transcription factor [Elusimicrobiales bacterium]